jgi:uncharacterized protein
VKLENWFEVPAPPKQAWELLIDVPRVVPCMPGATLEEAVDETSWKATVAVKLGAISLSFKADVKLVEADELMGRAKLSTKAREARGRGNASATIESSLTPPGAARASTSSPASSSRARSPSTAAAWCRTSRRG